MLEAYQLQGKIDIELLQEMDKNLVKNDYTLVTSDAKILEKYLSITSAKDFKSSREVELQTALREHILE